MSNLACLKVLRFLHDRESILKDKDDDKEEFIENAQKMVKK